MPLPVREYLQHILDETDYLLKSSSGLDKATFLHDETLKRAYVRSIEIIGEYESHGFISDIEFGRKQPTGEFILRVSRVFGISMDQLGKDELDLHEEAEE